MADSRVGSRHIIYINKIDFAFIIGPANHYKRRRMVNQLLD